jgi:phage-related protein
MESAAQEGGVGINDLFTSVEAGNAALALTGKGTDKFTADLEEMAAATGATEKAFDTMDESTGRSMEKMMAMFEEIKLEIGDVFLPILKDQILPVIKTLLDQFSEMPDWMKPVIVAIGAMGAALVVLGPLLIALPTAITGISAAFTILSANPIVLVIAGIIAALIILETKFGLVSKTIEFLSDVFSDFLGWILPATEGAIGGVGDFFTGIFDGIVAAADILFGVLKTMWSWTPLGIVTDNWDAISGFLSGAWDGISSTAGGALSGLAEMFGGAWDGISNTTGDWAGNMSDTFSSAIGTVEGIISPFVQMLPQEYQDMFADIGSAAKSFVSGDFKGAFKSMYDFGKKYTDLVFKQFNSFKKSTVDLFKSLSRSVSDIWNGIYRSIASVVNSITGTINTLIRGMNRLKFDVPDWVPFIGGMEWGFNIPEIPMLAEGGIVTRPTLAMIGEAGPEAVIPLSEFGSQPGGGDININIDSMTVRNDQDIKMIANELYSLVSVKNRARGI